MRLVHVYPTNPTGVESDLRPPDLFALFAVRVARVEIVVEAAAEPDRGEAFPEIGVGQDLVACS